MRYFAGSGLFLAIVAALYMTREVWPQSDYDAHAKQLTSTKMQRYAVK